MSDQKDFFLMQRMQPKRILFQFHLVLATLHSYCRQ